MAQGPPGDIPEGEPLPTEVQEALNAAERARLEAILDKAATDAAWKQQLLDDPETALAAIGQDGPLEVGEVAGQYHWRTKRVWRYSWYYGWYVWHWNW